MAGYKGMPRYSFEIKLQAVQMHIEQQMTCAQVGQQLGIRRVLVEQWCVYYRREGAAAFQKPIGRPRKDKAEKGTTPADCGWANNLKSPLLLSTAFVIAPIEFFIGFSPSSR